MPGIVAYMFYVYALKCALYIIYAGAKAHVTREKRLH